jgi:hypothetical protein
MHYPTFNASGKQALICQMGCPIIGQHFAILPCHGGAATKNSPAGLGSANKICAGA